MECLLCHPTHAHSSHVAWMLLCSPQCMTHTAIGRHCCAQLFILAFSISQPTGPLSATAVVSMHVPWKQHNSPQPLCSLLACCGSVWKEMICKIVSSMPVIWKNYRAQTAYLLVFYHGNYLLFDQCFPFLWTLLLFCKTRKTDKVLDPTSRQKRGYPHSVVHLSQQCSPAAEGHTLLLSSVCSDWGSVYDNGAFEVHFSIFTGRFSQGWKKKTRLTYW